MTFYEVLGVPENATDSDIKSAYHKLAIKWHPDKNRERPDAAEKFKEVTRAYETLRDSERRKKYDIERTAPPPPTAGSRHPFGQRDNGESRSYDLADALRIFMMNMRGDTGLRESFSRDTTAFEPSQGANIQIHITLELSEIAAGCQKTIKITHKKKCASCSGKGVTSEKAVLLPCRQCNGHGIVRVVGRADTIQCTACSGSGKELKDPCPTCSGTGQTKGESSINVKFPKGIAAGNYLILSGLGDAGLRGGKTGDLLIFIDEKENNRFKRRGIHLETDTEVPVLTVILGGKASVTTLDGELRLFPVNPGTQPESLYSIKGQGLPQYNGPDMGDLFVRLHVRIPEHLSAEERRTYEIIASGSLTAAKTTPSSDNLNNTPLIRQTEKGWMLFIADKEFPHDFFQQPEVFELLEKQNTTIGLDLRAVVMIDSLAIGKLIRALKQTKKNNTDFFLFGIQKSIREILKETNLLSLFKITDQEESLTQVS
ncbi:MAG: hypothetical protein A2293_05920 [Elusimicrobia bacterium RIFOXYB2_FULL_49_7]|nr:MAG: hypothetical protein A2293_05920 [Elusimicrobia bacterium RIFOXYB2_FULL_49_7]